MPLAKRETPRLSTFLRASTSPAGSLDIQQLEVQQQAAVKKRSARRYFTGVDLLTWKHFSTSVQ